MSKQSSKLSTYIKEKRGSLVHYVRSRVSEVDAEDVLHDAIVGVLSSDEIETVREITGYLFQGIRHRIVDWYRRKDRNSLFEQSISDDSRDQFIDEGSDSSRIIENEELRNALFEAIDSLPPAERAIWIATELEGRSFSECATLWDEPIGTLLSRKSRATGKLRLLLEEYAPIVSK
jgi:RNA polymerase sigma factor (sigma-70 family)